MSFTSEVIAPLTVKFTDTTPGAFAWAWDFADGQTSTEQHPTHVYAAPGNYTVSLTANAVSSASNEVTVDAPADPPVDPPAEDWLPITGMAKAIVVNAAGEPTNTIYAVRPGVNNGPVVGAWGSMALAGPSAEWPLGAGLFWNGGDGDYWGTEVYACPFHTMMFERLSEPHVLAKYTDPDYLIWKAAGGVPGSNPPNTHIVSFSRQLPETDSRYWDAYECEHGPRVPGILRGPDGKPLLDASGKWQVDPAAPPPGLLPVGTTPGVPHNYDGVIWIPGKYIGKPDGKGALLVPHTTFAFTTSSTVRAHYFDLDERRWGRFSANTIQINGGRLNRSSFDETMERIYHSFGWLDLVTKTQVSKQWAMNHDMSVETKMLFDPTRRLWIGANTTVGDAVKTEPGALIAVQPDAGLGYVTLPMQGDLWPRGYGRDAGLAYVPDVDCYYLYNCLGSNDTIRPLVDANVLFKIAPPSANPLTTPWTVTKEIMEGEVPERTPSVIGKTIGNQGRFFWHPQLKRLGFMNGVSQPFYFYTPRGL